MYLANINTAIIELPGAGVEKLSKKLLATPQGGLRASDIAVGKPKGMRVVVLLPSPFDRMALMAKRLQLTPHGALNAALAGHPAFRPLDYYYDRFRDEDVFTDPLTLVNTLCGKELQKVPVQNYPESNEYDTPELRDHFCYDLSFLPVKESVTPALEVKEK